MDGARKGTRTLRWTGFEPAASANSAIRAGVWCPGPESNRHATCGTAPSTLRVYQFRHLGMCLFGASEWVRTTDACAFNAALYQLSYKGLENVDDRYLDVCIGGASYRDRTGGFPLDRRALWPLS